MAEAILTSSSSSFRILFSNTTASFSRLPTLHSHSPRRLRPPALLQRSGAAVAAGPAVTEAKTQPKSAFQIQNLTTWLLMQEQAGHIDAELVVVLSSISLACKQIASLLRTSSIVKLTGTQGTVNVQGEDQKKLDVISNEVNWTLSLQIL